tara:strand:+ start:3687 stop:3893 length:207 start_codon:yes stop_codon:yes gene_type:complete
LHSFYIVDKLGSCHCALSDAIILAPICAAIHPPDCSTGATGLVVLSVCIMISLFIIANSLAGVCNHVL